MRSRQKVVSGRWKASEISCSLRKGCVAQTPLATLATIWSAVCVKIKFVYHLRIIM